MIGHTSRQEEAPRMARILNATSQEPWEAQFIWEMFVFLFYFIFASPYANPSPVYFMKIISLSIYWIYATCCVRNPQADGRVKMWLENCSQGGDLSGDKSCLTNPDLGSRRALEFRIHPCTPVGILYYCCIPFTWNFSAQWQRWVTT